MTTLNVSDHPVHTEKCPVCGRWAPYPVVDIGVGEQQCGPAMCGCGWVQPEPDELFGDDKDDELVDFGRELPQRCSECGDRHDPTTTCRP